MDPFVHLEDANLVVNVKQIVAIDAKPTDTNGEPQWKVYTTANSLPSFWVNKSDLQLIRRKMS